jgi:hypothetical protein
MDAKIGLDSTTNGREWTRKMGVDSTVHGRLGNHEWTRRPDWIQPRMDVNGHEKWEWIQTCMDGRETTNGREDQTGFNHE